VGQQWVHRRGLVAFDRFVLTALVPSQGQEAAQWLCAQLGLAELVAPPVQIEAPLPVVTRESPVDELAAELEDEVAVATEESQGQRPALFGRVKDLWRHCIDELIVGLDHGEPQQEASGPDVADFAAAQPPLPLQSRQPDQQVPALLEMDKLGTPATPAPAPASLAALRAWLPDANENADTLPRAC
jgi:hypothetical protein